MISQFFSVRSALKNIRLLCPLFLILIFQIPLRGQPNTFTLNFEEGNLRGWQVIGEAFRNQPTYGDNSRERNAGPSNLEGNWWIGTYEDYQGKPGQEKGHPQKDGPTGRLYSPIFEIPKGKLSFLIGGGSSHDTRVELCVGTGPGEFQSNVVYTASGKNRETMERVTWDLDNHAGQKGFINIVDYSTGPWGHINVDDFVFIPERVMPPDNERRFNRVEVPNLYGLRLNEANEQLRTNSLSLGSVTEEESDREKGTIISQNPAGGNLAIRNSTVSIVIAKARMVSVPYLIGNTYEGAKTLLESQSLTIQNSGSRESEMEPGRIVAQIPEPNTKVEAKSAVKVYSAMQILVNVPDLSGLSKEAAEERIRNSRLTPGEIKYEESDKGKDKIFNQYPAPGTRVKIREQVKFWISSGPKKIAVPYLIGNTYDKAKAILDSKDLVIQNSGSKESEMEPGSIVTQIPEPGTQVEVKSTVQVFTAVRTYTYVPDISGLSKEAAAERIKSSQLVPGEIKNVESDKEKDKIFNQDPKPGTKVKIGEQVKFWISSGPKKVDVPDLIGLPRGEAVRIILKKNLTLGQVSQVNEDKASGIVLNQTPIPGAKVDPGSKISIKIQKQIYALTLIADTSKVDSGKTVKFSASITPPPDKVQFEFNYGDGQKSNWTSKPVQEYIYPKPGSYHAYVLAKIGNETIQSDPVIIYVDPVKGWPIDLIVALALGGAGTVSYVVRKVLHKIPVRVIDFRTNKGKGIQTIKDIKGLNVNMNIRLRPASDSGKYRIIMN